MQIKKKTAVGFDCFFQFVYFPPPPSPSENAHTHTPYIISFLPPALRASVLRVLKHLEMKAAFREEWPAEGEALLKQL